MARIFRRAANKVINFRDGHESIGLLISDEKVVYESFQKVVMAQMDESISLLKWAKCEENQAIQDVFSKAFEVSSMWTSSWRDFNQEYYLYRKTFKEVLKEERVLDEARKRQAMHTTKLNRLQKQLEQSKRKSYTGKYSSLASEIAEAKKLRDSMLQISDGLNQWASKTLLVAEAYSKLANLIPDTPTQVSESKFFHGTVESRNIVNNLASDLVIDPELSQQLKDMSHSAQCNLYAVSTPILPAQQNGVKCNHVGLNSEKTVGKVNRKPVGQKGMSPQVSCHHQLNTKKIEPNFGRAQSGTDLRPPPISPPPCLPKKAPAHTTSKVPPRENNNDRQCYASVNISSNSDSDIEEGYAKPYSDPSLVQRKMLWKVLSAGEINTAGRIYEDKDVATCHHTENHSEEDLSHDDESAGCVDFIDNEERKKQPDEKLLQDNESAAYVDFINDVASATQTGKGLLQDGESPLYFDLINDAESAMLSDEALPKDNKSVAHLEPTIIR
ncbi:uncharacterized protein LOC141892070 isoform X2 [Acropora palmata]|uniref:uncharacterized protein LOC141892070 isoform X2 n=1 Tax=Acropora palmata TaxID=6131 RepID=UPI003DA1A40E